MLTTTLATLAALAAQPADTPFVSTAWLAERIDDPKLVLFEVGERSGYDAGHIPGAQFIEMRDVAAPHVMGPDGHDPRALVLELPSPERLDSVLEARGVSDDSRIVLYMGKDWLTPTARVYFTLVWGGLGARVSVLEGGLPAWREAGHAVSVEIPTPATRGSVTIRPQPDVVTNADWVRAHLRDERVAVIDARAPEFYTDSADNHMPRGGHIPGARNVPFGSLTDSAGVPLNAATLRDRFREAGAEPGDRVVVYCHIGQQGSWVWLVARSLGYDAKLYDGSFQDWSARSDLPVEGARRARAQEG